MRCTSSFTLSGTFELPLTNWLCVDYLTSGTQFVQPPKVGLGAMVTNWKSFAQHLSGAVQAHHGHERN
jgi:hypothetical protein